MEEGEKIPNAINILEPVTAPGNNLIVFLKRLL